MPTLRQLVSVMVCDDGIQGDKRILIATVRMPSLALSLSDCARSH